MGEVFLSYAREDAATANALADALTDEGFAVWADVSSFILGEQYDQVVAQALDAAGCVVVLWSQFSVQSPWVKDEAGYARDRGTLIPVRIESVSPPMGFGSIHTGTLIDWSGERDRADYQALLRAMKVMLGEEDASASTDDPPLRPPMDTAQRLQEAVAEASRSDEPMPSAAETPEPDPADPVPTISTVPTPSSASEDRVAPTPEQLPPPTAGTSDLAVRRVALIVAGLAAVAAVVIGVFTLLPGAGSDSTTTIDVDVLGDAVAVAVAPDGWPGFDPQSDVAFVTGAGMSGDDLVVLGTGRFGGTNQTLAWPLDPDAAVREPVGVTEPGEGVEMHALVVSEGTLVAGGDRRDADAVVYTSSDGVAWEEAAIDGRGEPAASVRAISGGDAGFVAAGYTSSSDAPRGAALWTSADGLTWERVVGVFDSEVTQQLDSAATSGSTMVAAGRDGTPAQGGMRPLVMVSDDAGVSWDELNAPSVGDGSRMQSVTWTGSDFVAVGWSINGDATSPVVWRSDDGRAWDVVWFPGASPDGSSAMMVSVAQTDLGLVAAGAVSDGESSDFATWVATSDEGWSRVDWLPEVDGPTQEAMPMVLVPVDGGAFIGGWVRPIDGERTPVGWIVGQPRS